MNIEINTKHKGIKMLPMEKREKALELAEILVVNIGMEKTLQEILNCFEASEALENMQEIVRQWEL